jgi:hypothetical protein
MGYLRLHYIILIIIILLGYGAVKTKISVCQIGKVGGNNPADGLLTEKRG